MVLRHLAVCFVIILFSCETSDAYNSNNEASNGESIYQLHCFDCHGDNGKLGLGGAADLSLSKINYKDRISIITNGSKNGKMRPFGKEKYGELSDSEIKSVANYIETLKVQ